MEIIDENDKERKMMDTWIDLNRILHLIIFD